MFLTLHTFSSRLVTIFAPLIVFLMLSWQFQVRHKPGDMVFREPFKKHFSYNKGGIKKSKRLKHITVMCSYCLEYIIIFSNFLIYVLQ